MEANAYDGTDTIQVKPGTYNFAIGGADGDTPNAAKGDLDLTDTVNIYGAGRGGIWVQQKNLATIRGRDFLLKFDLFAIE